MLNEWMEPGSCPFPPPPPCPTLLGYSEHLTASDPLPWPTHLGWADPGALPPVLPFLPNRPPKTPIRPVPGDVPG